jgi:hypothetical protein
MLPSVLLRVAALLSVIQYAAHAWLFVSATPQHGREEVELLQAMKSHRWRFGGFMRSYWDFYFGYGLIAILWGVIEIVLLWQLAALAGTHSAWVTRAIAALLAANIGHAILTLRYFFLIPAIFDILIAVVLSAALLTIPA